MHDSRFKSGRARRRFTLGIILMVVGLITLASRLGVEMPRHLWAYWPWLVFVAGGLQMLVPGTFRERMAGYWLVVIGGWGLIATYEVFGLDSWTSLPIFVIAAGFKMMLSSIFTRPPEQIVVDGSQPNKTV